MSEKWWDMSDDELDDLFREASDKVDVPFDSSAFDKLRHKMDLQPKSEPVKGFGRKWLLLLIGLFLLVGVGLVYRFRSLNEGGLTNNRTGGLDNPIHTDYGNKATENEEIAIKNIAKSDREKNALNADNQDVIVKKSTIEESNNVSPLPSQKTQEITKKSTSKNKQDLPQSSTNLTEQKVNKSSVELATTPSQTKAGKTNQAILRTENSLGSQIQKENLPTVETTDNQTTINDKSKVAEREKGLSVSEKYTTRNESINSSEKTKIYTENPDNQSIESLEVAKNNSEKNNWKTKNRSSNTKINEQFQPIEGQNIYAPTKEESFITKENLGEESVVKMNFFGVDYLTNKNTISLRMDIQPFEIQPCVDSIPRKIFPPKFSRFGVRLVLSPEINSIENLGMSPLGGSLGILFEYSFSKKLILQTGLIYSNKKYGGDFDYYRNWSDWTKYHTSKPTSVDGGCKMIDLPINLRLNLFQKSKQTWFVSSGVTSYWMMNENYAYSYAWGPAKNVDWSDDTKYYWSVLNFSVGFEKQFSKHISLQIEPYLKTPLKSVGRGGVNLYSSGLMFSTKYAF